MVGYVHARKPARTRPDLSFLAGGLQLPWVTFIFITGFVIEALLAARLWLQMTTSGPTSGIEGLVISVTDVLVSPFRGYETTVIGERASGIFEFSTLVAVEAYLIGMLVIVLLIVSTRFLAFTAAQALATKRRHDSRRNTRMALKPQLEKIRAEQPKVDVPSTVTVQQPSTEVTQ